MRHLPLLFPIIVLSIGLLCADNFALTAYWYQMAPHVPFPKLTPLSERWTR